MTTDVFSPQKRSEIMSKVRSTNTTPELLVRSLLHRAGFRFRLHRKDLPGKPDLVLPKHQTVILVHGCFWHQHPRCRKATIPVQNAEQWRKKLIGNVKRDRKTKRALRRLGWKVLVAWECDVRRDPQKVLARLRRSLESDAT